MSDEDERLRKVKGLGDKGRSYADFSDAVKRTLFNVLDLPFPQAPVFTAQQSKWDLPMQSLSGLYAHQYLEKFEALRAIPPCDLNPILDRERRLSAVPDEEIENWKSRKPDTDPSNTESSDRGPIGGSISPQVLSNARFLARKYMASKPGSHTSGAQRLGSWDC